MTLSSAPISGVVPIEKPVKYVKNKSNSRANYAEYKVGDQFDFEVDQRVNTLGTDILKRYSSFVIGDVLPGEVDYVSAKLYDDSGQEVTDGTVSYDQTNRTLTWTAKPNFLKNMPLNGEVYTLKITVKANSKLKSAVAKNKVFSKTNGKRADSNEVSVVTIPDNPKKTVNLKYVNDITTFEYRVSQDVPALIDANSKYRSFSLTDTIGKVENDDQSAAFDLNSTTVKVIDKSTNDNKTSLFTIDKNGATITATATSSALQSESFYGKIYEMVITTKIKEDYFKAKGEGAKTVINNKASRNMQPSHQASWAAQATTNSVPTTVVNPRLPKKYLDNDTEMVRPLKEYNYIISHQVQPATEDNYYKSYVFTDVLESPLQISGAEKVKIVQQDASGSKTDWTDKFDINVDGNKVTCTLKNPKDPSFYGTRDSEDKELLKTYIFMLTVSLRENPENTIDMSKYIDDLRYVIPNKATITSTNDDDQSRSDDTNVVNVYYYPDPEPIKDVDVVNITDLYSQDKEFTYSITKKVLNYDEALYYDSFVFKDTLEDCLVASDRLVIKNEAGIVVTSWFDIKVDGQTVTATLKDSNNNSNFYGHTYTFDLMTKVKKGYKLDAWKRGNQYIIPNEASFVLDNNIVLKTNKKDVLINQKVLKVPITGLNFPLYVVLFAVLLLGSAGIGGYYVYKDKKFFVKK